MQGQIHQQISVLMAYMKKDPSGRIFLLKYDENQTPDSQQIFINRMVDILLCFTDSYIILTQSLRTICFSSVVISIISVSEKFIHSYFITFTSFMYSTRNIKIENL